MRTLCEHFPDPLGLFVQIPQTATMAMAMTTRVEYITTFMMQRAIRQLRERLRMDACAACIHDRIQEAREAHSRTRCCQLRFALTCSMGERTPWLGGATTITQHASHNVAHWKTTGLRVPNCSPPSGFEIHRGRTCARTSSRRRGSTVRRSCGTRRGTLAS